MDKEKIKNLSYQVAAAEEELALGKNVKSNQQKIVDIMYSLSFEEMLKLDDYVTNLLQTKEGE